MKKILLTVLVVGALVVAPSVGLALSSDPNAKSLQAQIQSLSDQAKELQAKLDTATPSPVFQSNIQAGVRVKTTASLKVRPFPSISGNAIEVKKEGSTGVVVGELKTSDGYTWAKVQYGDGVEGWSAISWLDVDGGGSDTSTVCGDINGDGLVNLGDIVPFMQYIFQGEDTSNPGNGDANGDGIVNVTDLIYLMNYINGSGPAPICTAGETPITFSCGDANHDGKVDSNDALGIIRYIFSGAGLPGMTEANVDGNNIVNISDVIYLIQYLEQNGPAPNCPLIAYY